MKFENRWKIEGTLTTLTPMRIGDSDTIEAKKRLLDKDGEPLRDADDNKIKTYLKEDTLVNTIATDKYKKPYIPASAIKGNLRSWAENVLSSNEIEIIFGSTNPQDENARAGKVQFSNAYLSVDPPPTDFSDLPDWSSERLTAVSVGIAVDRKTRTASDQKLFHQEYVPAGITFRFEISGNDYEEESLKGDETLKKLLYLLEGFNSKSKPVCIGAETVDLDESWGRLNWSLSSINRTNAKDIKTWFESDNDQKVDVLLKEIDDETRNKWIEEAKEEVNSITNDEISLSLQFLDDFLVNDPSKTKRDKDEDSDRPNHSPLRDKDGKPILPKSSIKGAVRSQAERILRTIAISAGCPEKNLKAIACYPDDMTLACPPIKTKEEVKDLCLACQLFGASGWKSPMSFSDFTGDKSIFVTKKIVEEKETLIPKRREFVAIDRFTGGVSGGGKFNAEVAHRPILTGKISFDKSRFDKVGIIADWTIGLLALTFRDLIEGDIRFGFGRAKGFGKISVDAELTEILQKEKQELIGAVKALEDTIGGKINGVS